MTPYKPTARDWRRKPITQDEKPQVIEPLARRGTDRVRGQDQGSGEDQSCARAPAPGHNSTALPRASSLDETARQNSDQTAASRRYVRNRRQLRQARPGCELGSLSGESGVDVIARGEVSGRHPKRSTLTARSAPHAGVEATRNESATRPADAVWAMIKRMPDTRRRDRRAHAPTERWRRT